MNLKDYSQEELKAVSLVDLARELLVDEKAGMSFKEIFNQVAALKGLTEEEKNNKVGQFYTDLNMDGSFISKGSNIWALKQFNREWKKTDVEEISIN